MSQKKARSLRGCTDSEVVEVLALADGGGVPSAYIDFLIQRGAGPDPVLRGGSRWSLYYPALLDFPRLLDGRLECPEDFFPFALEIWDEGSHFFSTEELVAYGFLSGRPEVQRVDASGTEPIALTLDSWLASMEF